MKQVVSFIWFLSLGIFHSFSQEENSLITLVEEEAKYPGGAKEMALFLARNIQYPETALDQEIQGKAIIRFMIDKEGQVKDVRVLKGVPGCSECDKEAVRVIKMMPKWKPAMYKGEGISSYFNLPIIYRLPDPEEEENK